MTAAHALQVLSGHCSKSLNFCNPLVVISLLPRSDPYPPPNTPLPPRNFMTKSISLVCANLCQHLFFVVLLFSGIPREGEIVRHRKALQMLTFEIKSRFFICALFVLVCFAIFFSAKVLPELCEIFNNTCPNPSEGTPIGFPLQ